MSEQHDRRLQFAAYLDLWDRQPGETSRQYGRFLTFRDLGRSRKVKDCVQPLAQKGERVPASTLHRACWRYRWIERAEAWDAHEDQRWSVELDDLRRQMIRRHLKTAAGLSAKGVAGLVALNPKELSARAVVDLVKLGADLERQSLALPDKIVGVSGPGGGPVQVDDLAGLTPQARRARLAELSAEIGRRAASDSDDDADGVYPMGYDGDAYDEDGDGERVDG